MKKKIEMLIERFELMASCAESYETLGERAPWMRDPDPVKEAAIVAHWKTEKEINAYHARILRQEILGWSPS